METFLISPPNIKICFKTVFKSPHPEVMKQVKDRWKTALFWPLQVLTTSVTHTRRIYQPRSTCENLLWVCNISFLPIVMEAIWQANVGGWFVLLSFFSLLGFIVVACDLRSQLGIKTYYRSAHRTNTWTCCICICCHFWLAVVTLWSYFWYIWTKSSKFCIYCHSFRSGIVKTFQNQWWP